MNLPLYSLDTNILSDLVRHPQGVVAKKIAVVGENEICISIIVAAELRFGAAKRNSARLSNQVETILAAMLVVPFDVPTDREYAKLRQLLESSGNSIGPNDLLIAAQARANGQILVTNNVREFTRVPQIDGPRDIRRRVHQRKKALDEVRDVAEGSRLAAVAVDGQRLSFQGAGREIADDPTIVRVHTGAVRIE